MTFDLAKEIYSKEAVLKAAYCYTDRFYIHIDAADNYYKVSLQKKTDSEYPCEEEFLNEVLAQMIRIRVRKQTKSVREMMLARAFSSTVIDDEKAHMVTTEPQGIDINDIMKDWFEKYE